LDKANGDENLALEYHTHKKIPPSSMGNTMLTSTNTEHNHSKEGDVSSLNKPTVSIHVRDILFIILILEVLETYHDMGGLKVVRR